MSVEQLFDANNWAVICQKRFQAFASILHGQDIHSLLSPSSNSISTLLLCAGVVVTVLFFFPLALAELSFQRRDEQQQQQQKSSEIKFYIYIKLLTLLDAADSKYPHDNIDEVYLFVTCAMHLPPHTKKNALAWVALTKHMAHGHQSHLRVEHR